MLNTIDAAALVELAELSELKSAALEAAANAIIISDRNGTILWINSAFTLLTGYSRQEAIGSILAYLNPARIRNRFISPFGTRSLLANDGKAS